MPGVCPKAVRALKARVGEPRQLACQRRGRLGGVRVAVVVPMLRYQALIQIGAARVRDRPLPACGVVGVGEQPPRLRAPRQRDVRQQQRRASTHAPLRLAEQPPLAVRVKVMHNQRGHHAARAVHKPEPVIRLQVKRRYPRARAEWRKPLRRALAHRRRPVQRQQPRVGERGQQRARQLALAAAKLHRAKRLIPRKRQQAQQRRQLLLPPRHGHLRQRAVGFRILLAPTPAVLLRHIALHKCPLILSILPGELPAAARFARANRAPQLYIRACAYGHTRPRRQSRRAISSIQALLFA